MSTSTHFNLVSTLATGFTTAFTNKGFGGFVAAKKKPKIGNKREAMQKASRKANRSHKASTKQFPCCSLIHHQTQVVKAAYAAKVAYYKPIKKAPKPVVVFERPILKVAIPALKRAAKPSLKKDKVVIKGVKSPKPSSGLPTIIGNLALGSKAYKGAGRPTKGKKFPNKPKSQAKKASKRCAHAAISNIQVGSHMSQLVSIAQAEGYKVSFANTGSSLGLVDHTSKEILVNTTNMALQEYVLAHELVHVAYSKGLVKKLAGIHLSPYAQQQGDEYWKQVEGTYSSTEVFEEKLASYLMWMPEYVISLFTSSTTGEAPSESVGDVISNVSNQEKQVLRKFNTVSQTAPSSVLSDVVDLIIPKVTMNKTDKNVKTVEKKEAEVADKKAALMEFFTQHGINPVPNWGATLLVIEANKNRVARMPKAFYELMEAAGVEFFGQRITFKGGKEVKKGVKISLGSKFKTTPWEEGMEFNTEMAIGNLPINWSSHLASELAKLSPENYAKLIAIFCNKAEVSGSIVSIVGSQGNSFATTKFLVDLNTKEVTARSTRKAHERVEIAKTQFDSKFALFILAIQLCTMTSNTRINATLAELPNLWEREDNYGAKMKPTDPTRVSLDNLVLPMTFTGARKNVFPFVKIVNDQFDCASLTQVKEAVAVDKYAKQWMTLGKGANAMMLGRSVDKDGNDVILNPHDGGKAAKEYNRPTQGMKFLKADSPVRTYSKLSIDLGDGTYSIPEGTMLMTAFTNSRLGAGSGVSFIKPGTKIHYQVEKTLTGQVTTLRVPKAIREKMASLPGSVFENLKEAVTLQAEKLVGKTFQAGEPILALFKGQYEIIRNDNYNQSLTVTGVEIIDLNAIKGRADSFQVKLTVLLDEKDDCLKLRNMGIKLTTLPYPVKGLRDDWQLILNNETAKGKLGLLHLFANKYGGVYFPNEGRLILDNPCELKEGGFDTKVINLKDSENAFTQWVKENASSVFLTMPIAKTEWEVIKASHPDADDIEVLEVTSTYVTVKERIQVIYGLMPYEVEISTPRENTGTGSLTLEQIAALSLQNSSLAEKIWEESKEYQQTIKDLVESVLQTNLTGNLFVLSTRQGRDDLRAALSGEFSSDREMMKKLEVAFPKGLVLSAVNNDSDTFVSIKPNVLARMGTFFGKSASGISLDVLSLFHYILDSGIEKDSGIDSVIYSWVEKLKKSFEAWLESMAKSNGVLKKLGRTGPCLVNLKIKTTYHPLCEPTNGLPTIVLHPDCASIRLLGIKDGDLVGIGRTPMPFVTTCVVRLSSDVGRIGHVMAAPSIWSAGNEGDSDGDGIFTLNLTGRGVTLSQALTMNAHAMGQAGYSLVYGKDVSNHPYAEFCSYADKWGKKQVNKVGTICRQIPFGQYTLGAKLVSDHYSFAVGISYGICSVLTFYTANLKYAKADAEQLRIAELATVVAWRMLYEGLGLSGYSEKAASFFEILRVASFSKDNKYIIKEGKVDFPNNGKNGEKTEDAIPKLVALAKIEHMEDASAIMRSIIAANQIRMGYSRLENAKKVSEGMINKSALFGALRRMGQGKYGIDPMDEFSQESQMVMDDELTPRSTYSIVKAKSLYNLMHCPFLKSALSHATEIHFELAMKWVEDEENEMFEIS